MKLATNSIYLFSLISLVGSACITDMEWDPELVTGQSEHALSSPGPDCVRLYDECNYGGTYYDACGDLPGLGGQNFNDKTSSVKLGANVDSAVLYQHSNYGGSTVTVSADESCLTTLNNETTSVGIVAPAVPPDCVRLYDQCNYGGDYYDACGDYPALGGQAFNDRTSSIKLGANVDNVVLYQHVSYGGRAVTVTADDSCLADLNNETTSLDVTAAVAPDCVRIYDECNYGGEYYDACGDYPALGGQAFNDRTSSLKLGANVDRVILYQHVSYGGLSVTVTADDSCLAELNNETTSLDVVPTVAADCVRLYDECGFRGSFYDACSDLPGLGGQGFNDKTSAVKLGANLESVVLYQHSNYGGATFTVSADDSCLASFDNETTALDLVPAPRSHWSFDEAGGVSAADNGSNRLNASLVTGASFAGPAAPIGAANPNALSFASNGYASIADHSSIDFAAADDFTVAVWIRAEASQPAAINGDSDVVEKWSGIGGYPFVLRYVNQLGGANSGKIVVARYDGANNPGIMSTQTIHDGQFHHVAFVKRGQTLSLYVDGVLDGTATDTTTGNTTNDSPLYLGRRGGGMANEFTGAIDDLRIYSTGLSASEVGWLANLP